MRLKACLIVFFVSQIVFAGCSQLSNDGSISSATFPDTREPTVIVTPLDNTQTPIPTTELRADTPAPTTEANFKLPDGTKPGWLAAFDPAVAGASRFALTPDSKWVALGVTRRNSILFYDMTTGEEVASLSGPAPYGILDLAFTLDGKQLIVSSTKGINVWDVGAKTFQTIVADFRYAMMGTYTVVEVSPDGSFLAVGPTLDPSDEGSKSWRTRSVEIWSIATWERLHVLKDAQPPYSFSPDGKTLASLSGPTILESSLEPGPPILWDVQTGSHRMLSVEGYPVKLAYSPDGETLAINTFRINSTTRSDLGITGTLLLNVKTGEVKQTVRPGDIPHNVIFSPDGELLAVEYDDRIILWDIQSGNQLLVIDDPAKLRRPAFSPNGKLLAAVSSDGRILFWNVPNH